MNSRITSMTQEELESFYDILASTSGPTLWPSGTFDGYAWHPRWRIIHSVTAPIWKGKIFFSDGVVWNRVAGGQHVRGELTWSLNEFVLSYGFGLVDTLRMVTPSLYLCKFFFHHHRVLYFLLAQTPVTLAFTAGPPQRK